MTDRPNPNPATPNITLSAEDAAVLDAILEARARGSEQGPMPPGSAPRAGKVHELLGLLDLDQTPVDEQPSDGELDVLTSELMEAVTAQRQQRRFAEQAQMFAEPRKTTGVAWRQVMTAAAVFCIGFSLLLPVLNKVNADAKRTACASGMGTISQGFGSYAQDHDGELPRYRVQPAGAWWRVGQAKHAGEVQSNSANLYLLVRKGYVNADVLNCPANGAAPAPGSMTAEAMDYNTYSQISYSYQNQFTARPVKLADGSAGIAILADKNPLFVIRPNAFRRSAQPVTAPSVIHSIRGQNVLLGDGQVQWITRPLIDRADGEGQDNIWTARGVESYEGSETPADANDSFLVP